MTIYKIERNKFQAFPYHLVDPSPWPILVGFSLLSLMLGAAMYLHGFNYGGNLLTIGFTLTTLGMILWFRDVITEATYLGHHTIEVQKGLSIGFLLFIVSEIFAFFSVFWGFFHASLSPSVEIGGSWPPLGITPLDPFAIPLLNTILLLSSGAFVTYGHHALIGGNRKGAIIGTLLTIIFAILFTALQYYEYSEAGFTMSDSVYGSAFYASTGLHGLHGAPFNHIISTITSVILNFIQYSIKQLTYLITKEVGNYSMSEKLQGLDPNLISTCSELCLYGLSFNIQLALRALGIWLGWILTCYLIVWMCSTFKGYITGKIIHNYRMIKTYVSYFIYLIINEWFKFQSWVLSHILKYGNWGLPKGRKTYGNGSGIVVRYKYSKKFNEVQKRKYCSKSLAVRKNGGESLEQLLKFDENGRCINAYDTLRSFDVLAASYQKIKSNPGNMTPGIDKETLDGINLEYFNKLCKLLDSELYKCKPTRRIYIPKANGKFRPLGISSPRDKIVQEAMRMILEHVLENKFSDASHGFRPRRGCHTALAKIRYWNGIKWFLEGDIKGFFDNIDHKILAKLLLKYFKDQRFLDLYWKFVKAGYVEYDKLVPNELGVPQGSIVSPILSNLYLDLFDKYIESIQNDLELKNKGEKSFIVNPVYAKLDNTIQNITKSEKRYIISGKVWKDQGEKLALKAKLIKERRKVRSTIPNPNFCKLYYVRYADDWLIGVYGSHKFVIDLKTKLTDWLAKNLKLELDQDKTLITKAATSYAKFLGVRISRISSVNNIIKNYRSKLNHSIRIATTATIMNAPIDELIDKFISRGLAEYKFNAKGSRILVGKPVKKWHNLPLIDIIIRYKSVLNGILN